MNAIEFEKSVEYLKELWNRWEPTVAQTQSLEKHLKPLGFFPFKAAAECVWGNQRRRTIDPPIQDIREQTRTLMGPYRPADDEKQPDNEIAFIITCIDTGVCTPYFLPLNYELYDQERFRQTAEQRAAKHTEAQGGTWVPLVDESGQLVRVLPDRYPERSRAAG